MQKTTTKRCFYEILGVDRKADLDTIKKAYKKLALVYHPDKYKGDDGKVVFQEILDAYNCLTDVNERSYYDNHRERILRGNKEDMTKEELDEQAFGFNIWPFFEISCFKGYTDEETGFYSVYRACFEKIKYEEDNAYKFSTEKDLGDFVKYHGFGDSNSSEDLVMSFYRQWKNFSSYKSFMWADSHDTREAENRDERRWMEKENKIDRKLEKAEYVETIKRLVQFCKMRDPRYQKFTLLILEQEKEKNSKRKYVVNSKDDEDRRIRLLLQQQMRLEEEKKMQEEEEALLQKMMNGKDQSKKQEDWVILLFQQKQQFKCLVCDDKMFEFQHQLLQHQKSNLHKKNMADKGLVCEEVPAQQVNGKNKKSNKKKDIETQINENQEDLSDTDVPVVKQEKPKKLPKKKLTPEEEEEKKRLKLEQEKLLQEEWQRQQDIKEQKEKARIQKQKEEKELKELRRWEKEREEKEAAEQKIRDEEAKFKKLEKKVAQEQKEEQQNKLKQQLAQQQQQIQQNIQVDETWEKIDIKVTSRKGLKIFKEKYNIRPQNEQISTPVQVEEVYEQPQPQKKKRIRKKKFIEENGEENDSDVDLKQIIGGKKQSDSEQEEVTAQQQPKKKKEKEQFIFENPQEDKQIPIKIDDNKKDVFQEIPKKNTKKDAKQKNKK